ncbi:hypothetical protein H6F88_21940 [Oculatella sp. FACHB-28]|uniref:hypothetical protein n=1 Tax=Oculatella sp. FACHB-28 TaxID=2692845 RepID=UPI001684CF7D|nr:hypothetical protein [Oculatella sp. FACHB-28]MBD2058627.1 hypothetical protein [Oculatella sp. FACHB-28]
MKVKGIKRAQTIELLETITTIPDGTEVEIDISEAQATDQNDRWASLERVLGSWKNDAEIETLFAEIDRERHADFGDPISFGDID